MSANQSTGVAFESRTTLRWVILAASVFAGVLAAAVRGAEPAPQDGAAVGGREGPQAAEQPAIGDRVIATNEELDLVIAGRVLGEDLRALRTRLETVEGAGRAGVALRRPIAERPLARLASALRDSRIPASALPVFCESAKAAVEPRRRVLALKVLGQHAVETLDLAATATLRELSLDPTVPTDVRVAAIEALGKNQDFQLRPDAARSHASHLRTLISSSAPSDVRATATRCMFGVGFQPVSGAGREEDVVFLMSCVERDRDLAVRTAAMRALPRWRGETSEDIKRLKRIDAMARDRGQPSIVRLTAIYLVLLSSSGRADEVLPDPEVVASEGRKLIAQGVDMKCWHCRRLLSAPEGCRSCRWSKAEQPQPREPKRH